MAKRLRFGIFPKVLLTMVVVAVIPLGAIWYINYHSAVAHLSGQVDQELGDRADAIVSYVDAWVDMNVKMLHQNAALDDIAAMDAKRQRRILLSIINEYWWAITLPVLSSRKAWPVRPICTLAMLLETSVMVMPMASTPASRCSAMTGTDRMRAGWPLVRLITTCWPTGAPRSTCCT